jgi:hypothetical protein
MEKVNGSILELLIRPQSPSVRRVPRSFERLSFGRLCLCNGFGA